MATSRAHIVGRYEYDDIQVDTFLTLPDNLDVAAPLYSISGHSDFLYIKTASGWQVVGTLGQPVGASGDPAELTEDREIPMGGHRIYFGKNDGVANTIAFDTNFGIFVANDTGYGISFGWQVGGHDTNWSVFTDDGNDVIMQFGTDTITYNGSLGPVFSFSQPIIAPALGTGGIEKISSSTTPVVTWSNTFSAIIYDTTSGAGEVDIDASLITYQFGIVKKKLTDSNVITIKNTTSGGLIYGSGVAASTYTFSGSGQAITFQSDGTHLYIL